MTACSAKEAVRSLSGYCPRGTRAEGKASSPNPHTDSALRRPCWVRGLPGLLAAPPGCHSPTLAGSSPRHGPGARSAKTNTAPPPPAEMALSRRGGRRESAVRWSVASRPRLRGGGRGADWCFPGDRGRWRGRGRGAPGLTRWGGEWEREWQAGSASLSAPGLGVRAHRHPPPAAGPRPVNCYGGLSVTGAARRRRSRLWQQPASRSHPRSPRCWVTGRLSVLIRRCCYRRCAHPEHQTNKQKTPTTTARTHTHTHTHGKEKKKKRWKNGGLKWLLKPFNNIMHGHLNS